MKEKKDRQKNMHLPQGNVLNNGFAASATDFTGIVPALGENDLEFMDEMYAELYGTSLSGASMPEEDYSQYKIPQI